MRDLALITASTPHGQQGAPGCGVRFPNALEALGGFAVWKLCRLPPGPDTTALGRRLLLPAVAEPRESVAPYEGWDERRSLGYTPVS